MLNFLGEDEEMKRVRGRKVREQKNKEASR